MLQFKYNSDRANSLLDGTIYGYKYGNLEYYQCQWLENWNIISWVKNMDFIFQKELFIDLKTNQINHIMDAQLIR